MRVYTQVMIAHDSHLPVTAVVQRVVDSVDQIHGIGINYGGLGYEWIFNDEIQPDERRAIMGGRP